MVTATPNMNITAGVLTNITTFTRITHTFVFVTSNVCKFPDIRWVVTSEANLGIFTHINTLHDTHTDESRASRRKMRVVVIIEHMGVSNFT